MNMFGSFLKFNPIFCGQLCLGLPIPQHCMNMKSNWRSFGYSGYVLVLHSTEHTVDSYSDASEHLASFYITEIN